MVPARPAVAAGDRPRSRPGGRGAGIPMSATIGEAIPDDVRGRVYGAGDSVYELAAAAGSLGFAWLGEPGRLGAVGGLTLAAMVGACAWGDRPGDGGAWSPLRPSSAGGWPRPTSNGNARSCPVGRAASPVFRRHSPAAPGVEVGGLDGLDTGPTVLDGGGPGGVPVEEHLPPPRPFTATSSFRACRLACR
jgi:hypothetical protein